MLDFPKRDRVDHNGEDCRQSGGEQPGRKADPKECHQTGSDDQSQRDDRMDFGQRSVVCMNLFLCEHSCIIVNTFRRELMNRNA